MGVRGNQREKVANQDQGSDKRGYQTHRKPRHGLARDPILHQAEAGR